MRLALLLLAPLLTASAVPPPAPAQAEIRTPKQAAPPGRNCAGRMETARQDSGTFKLRRDDAATTEPLMILAVDRQIDGCEVLVIGLHADDIRPLPQFQDGPGKMRPLR